MREKVKELDDREKKLKLDSQTSFVKPTVTENIVQSSSKSKARGGSSGGTAEESKLKDDSPYIVGGSSQERLLRATEAYRDLLFQHILEDCGADVPLPEVNLQSFPKNETPLERTISMLQKLERFCSSCRDESNVNIDSVTSCRRDGSENNYRERSLEAFRRLERAMEALS
ncbi:uncharacterized protein TM35_000011950 [Trypanosoma theileri]|uniref:Uncharacterized protein n=1 Tax=Trypanosoma theileri TaxID=67003 RepID=A0A1X0P8W9_9TRYP|nr:uncharacterized protein TM35_000011950 [Trypanosoma theileri]ORC93318.1 hypothetical protein TM35_000011950 [Trypanosoma theileri]